MKQYTIFENKSPVSYCVSFKLDWFLDIGIDILDYVHRIKCARDCVKVNLCYSTVQVIAQKSEFKQKKSINYLVKLIKLI